MKVGILCWNEPIYIYFWYLASLLFAQGGSRGYGFKAAEKFRVVVEMPSGTAIIHGPTDITVPVQQKVLEMECKVLADQSQGQVLTVNWKKDGKDFGSAGFPKTDRVQHHESNNSLILHDLAFSDSGETGAIDAENGKLTHLWYCTRSTY